MAGTDILNYDHLKPLYIVLHVLGLVGLVVITLTYFLSKNIVRHPTLVNFWITWILYSISYSILVYTGQTDDTNWWPPTLACRVQSAMVHGAAPMAGTSSLIIVIQIWTTFQAPQLQQTNQRKKCWLPSIRSIAAIALPYVVFLAFALATAIIGEHNLHSMNGSNGLYCTLEVEKFAHFGVPTYCTIVAALIICFEVAIIARYFFIWRNISLAFPLAERRTDMSLVVRVGLFNVYSVFVLSAGIFFMSDNLTPWPYMVQASVPLAAVVVFGTQADLFYVWRFWKPLPVAATNSTDDCMPSGHLFQRTETNSSISSSASSTLTTSTAMPVTYMV